MVNQPKSDEHELQKSMDHKQKVATSLALLSVLKSNLDICN